MRGRYRVSSPAWNFADDIPTQQIGDISGRGLHGELVNMPARAMTGHNWDGTHLNFRHAPEQWGAIHFHDDDLADARWKTDFEFRVPNDFRSGVYSVALSTETMDWHLPLFVEPGETVERADIAFLVPTLTYLAYANHRYAARPRGRGGTNHDLARRGRSGPPG